MQDFSGCVAVNYENECPIGSVCSSTFQARSKGYYITLVVTGLAVGGIITQIGGRCFLKGALKDEDESTKSLTSDYIRI